MVTPNALPLKGNACGIRRRHGAAGGTAIGTIQPAVRSPGQAVCNRVGVLQAEAREMDFGIRIRHIIAIRVRVKQ